MEKLGNTRLLIGKQEWALEQIFHRLRLARVGASGIQHRVIESEAEVLADLEKLLCASSS